MAPQVYKTVSGMCIYYSILWYLIISAHAATPLTVEVSDGTITCPSACNIVYGADRNNLNLPAVSGQRIPGLLPDVTYFYRVTQTIASQVVEVEGSFTLGV